ncbi:MAG: hypothetical protein IPK82_08485 [Polyangiaceae bacterium]|nr:hypothetical protein [Polyangiaceae bacterium]
MVARIPPTPGELARASRARSARREAYPSDRQINRMGRFRMKVATLRPPRRGKDRISTRKGNIACHQA